MIFTLAGIIIISALGGTLFGSGTTASVYEYNKCQERREEEERKYDVIREHLRNRRYDAEESSSSVAGDIVREEPKSSPKPKPKRIGRRRYQHRR